MNTSAPIQRGENENLNIYKGGEEVGGTKIFT